ncbi:MAG: 2,3-bisphosphoglycerate-independent phosphoglycerate mutase [Alphaproteobacteria bacterium]|nr:2,3-bisphosphoglycerate-independent phosphoglycerate mutase [Alphaproteobacteria bacterium]
MSRPCSVVLCILDGWGHRPERDHNAIMLAQTPVFDRLWSTCPHSLLHTAALEVGLPPGQMGNSEVGHTNIGAGRVVMQDLPRIDGAIADGSLASHPDLRDLIDRLRQTRGTCHLLGLVSPGGVHSHQNHIVALAKIVSAGGVSVVVHAFLDGRDTPPTSGRKYMAALHAAIGTAATIGTVGGRYYAMDRDKRWERVARAYDAIVDAKGSTAASADAAIAAAYGTAVTDEFLLPTVLAGSAGMKDGDGLLVANFRADRVRQILSALLDPAFADFLRSRIPRLVAAVGMTSYSEGHDRWLRTLFPSVDLKDTLGEVIARAGLTQLRIAETEKYAHVTFFFNGGEEKVFTGEQRIMVPSPRIATYDEQPAMSADEVTDHLVAAIAARTFDLIVCNFANTDMVGHTGRLDAAIKAVEAVDRCLGRIDTAVRASSAVLIITADHGNAERMVDGNGEPHTQHTLDDVPFLVVNAANVQATTNGRLADIAPTVLAIMGLPQPEAMTGGSLLRQESEAMPRRVATTRASARA